MTQVVAALIERDGKLLVCRRPPDKARGLLWEFAGGKVEAGETKEEALRRECREELGCELAVGSVYAVIRHDYPDLSIELTLFRAPRRSGRAARPGAQRAALGIPGRTSRPRLLPRRPRDRAGHRPHMENAVMHKKTQAPAAEFCGGRFFPLPRQRPT